MEPRYDGDIACFVVVGSLCGATVTLSERLDWRAQC